MLRKYHVFDDIAECVQNEIITPPLAERIARSYERWLDGAGICYDQVVFGKPPATYYIDDRAIPFRGSWDEVLNAIDRG